LPADEGLAGCRGLPLRIDQRPGTPPFEDGRRQEAAMALWKENQSMAPSAPTVRPTDPSAPAQGGPSAAQGGLAAKPADAPAPVLRYVDRPECAETFADSVSHVYFDGQSLRIEFSVTRLDELKPNTPITGRRYPAQRLALTPTAAVELINRMQQVANALTQAGVLKSNPPKP
jgi:hypothetical protein